ncbi:MAG: hypothetical protein ACYC6T_05495 [Thermoleophilia bacterium]
MKAHTTTRTPAVLRLLLVIGVTFALVLGVVGVASADGETTTTVAAAETTADAAPALDYTFTWPTFLVTFALVIGYYIFVFRMSEKEFKGVVAERFGVRAAGEKETP